MDAFLKLFKPDSPEPVIATPTPRKRSTLVDRLEEEWVDRVDSTVIDAAASPILSEKSLSVHLEAKEPEPWSNREPIYDKPLPLPSTSPLPAPSPALRAPSTSTPPPQAQVSGRRERGSEGSERHSSPHSSRSLRSRQLSPRSPHSRQLSPRSPHSRQLSPRSPHSRQLSPRSPLSQGISPRSVLQSNDPSPLYRQGQHADSDSLVANIHELRDELLLEQEMLKEGRGRISPQGSDKTAGAVQLPPHAFYDEEAALEREGPSMISIEMPNIGEGKWEPVSPRIQGQFYESPSSHGQTGKRHHDTPSEERDHKRKRLRPRMTEAERGEEQRRHWQSHREHDVTEFFEPILFDEDFQLIDSLTYSKRLQHQLQEEDAAAAVEEQSEQNEGDVVGHDSLAAAKTVGGPEVSSEVAESKGIRDLAGEPAHGSESKADKEAKRKYHAGMKARRRHGQLDDDLVGVAEASAKPDLSFREMLIRGAAASTESPRTQRLASISDDSRQKGFIKVSPAPLEAAQAQPFDAGRASPLPLDSAHDSARASPLPAAKVPQSPQPSDRANVSNIKTSGPPSDKSPSVHVDRIESTSATSGLALDVELPTKSPAVSQDSRSKVRESLIAALPSPPASPIHVEIDHGTMVAFKEGSIAPKPSYVNSPAPHQLYDPTDYFVPNLFAESTSHDSNDTSLVSSTKAQKEYYGEADKRSLGLGDHRTLNADQELSANYEQVSDAHGLPPAVPAKTSAQQQSHLSPTPSSAKSSSGPQQLASLPLTQTGSQQLALTPTGVQQQASLSLKPSGAQYRLSPNPSSARSNRQSPTPSAAKSSRSATPIPRKQIPPSMPTVNLFPYEAVEKVSGYTTPTPPHYLDDEREAMKVQKMSEHWAESEYERMMAQVNGSVNPFSDDSPLECGSKSVGELESEVGEYDNVGREMDWDYWRQMLEIGAQGEQDWIEYGWHLSDPAFAGVPPQLRSQVWSSLVQPDAELYSELLSQPCAWEEAIEVDVKQVLPTSVDSGVADRLARLLQAYSVYDREVGYRRGMAFVGAVIALEVVDEPTAFALLCQLMFTHDMRSIYWTPSKEGVDLGEESDGLAMRRFQFAEIARRQLPQLWEHLTSKGIDMETWMASLLLTGFAHRWPLPLVNQLYDAVLVEGIPILARFTVVLLAENEDRLMAVNEEAHLNALLSDHQALLDPCAQSPRTWMCLSMQLAEIDMDLLDHLAWEYEQMLQQSVSISTLSAINHLRAENQHLMDALCKLTTGLHVALVDRERLLRDLVEHKLSLIDSRCRNYEQSATIHILQSNRDERNDNQEL